MRIILRTPVYRLLLYYFFLLLAFFSISISNLVIRQNFEIIEQCQDSFKFGKSPCQRARYLLGIEDPKCNETCLSIDYFGRFGNQIFQFYHSYQVAKASRITKVLIFPGFLYQNESFVYDNVVYQVSTNEDRCLHHDFFFNKRKLSKLRDIEFNSNSWKLFQSKILNKYKAKVPKDALVVHVRSGDVFDTNSEHHKYGQPPCNYYLNAISMHNWSEIILVAEDNKNPCVNVIANKTGVVFRKRSFNEDFALMLNAKSLVLSSGTFGYAVILISRVIENAFCFNLNPKNIKKGCLKCVFINTYNCMPTDKYKKVVLKHWTNSDKQRELMMKDDCEYWSNFKPIVNNTL